MTRRASGARALLAVLALGAWSTHALVMGLVYGGAPHELLWACHLAPLLLAAGCALDRPALTSVATTWMALGTPLWLGNLVAGGRVPEPTPTLVHAGVLALGLATVRVVGWDRRAWWLASIALLALALATRLVPAAARDDVNLVFRVWPGLEPAFPTLTSFLAFLAIVIPISFYVIGRALERLAVRAPVASRARDRGAAPRASRA